MMALADLRQKQHIIYRVTLLVCSNAFNHGFTHSDNVPLTRCHELPVAPFNIITQSPVHGGSDTVNFTGRRVIDYAHPHLITVSLPP